MNERRSSSKTQIRMNVGVCYEWQRRRKYQCEKIIELVKTGLIMTIPLLLCGSFGLFGFGKSTSRQSEDLVRLSVSCLASNYAASYSFDIEKMGNSWLISADFESESGKESVRTKLESEVLDKADVEMLLTAVDDYKVIERVINYKKTKSNGRRLMKPSIILS